MKNQFLFTPPLIPDSASKEIKLMLQLAGLSGQQTSNTRTRCTHPDGRAENVAEHSLMLAKIAPILAELLYSQLDLGLVAIYSTLHDDIEAYVGDTPTDTLADQQQVNDKEQLEQAGLEQLLKDFANIPRYAEFVQQYYDQTTPEARFVRAVDKLMPLLVNYLNQGQDMKQHFTAQTFLDSQHTIVKRDRHKYSQFTHIITLRLELSQLLADQFLD